MHSKEALVEIFGFCVIYGSIESVGFNADKRTCINATCLSLCVWGFFLSFFFSFLPITLSSCGCFRLRCVLLKESSEFWSTVFYSPHNLACVETRQ